MPTVDEENAHSQPVRSRWRRFTLALTITLVATGLLLWLLPYAIEKGAVSWLQQHGVENARIDNIDLNLFSGEAVLEGLKSGDGLNIDHLSLDFDWLPLWHHIVHIRTLKLNASSLHLLEKKGIWQVAGIKTDAGKTAVSPTAGDDDRQPWLVVVDDLVLDKVNVSVKSSLFTLSLPLKSVHLSLSEPEHQQQRLMNRIDLGNTVFSGFGYHVRVGAAKVKGDVGLSILSDDLLASIKTDKLSLDMQGLKVRAAHDGRQITASSLKLDGIAPLGKDHIRIGSLDLKDIGIHHALDGQGDVSLGSLAVRSVDAKSGGPITLAKLTVKRVSAGGFTGVPQLLKIGKASLANVAWTAAKHIRIGSLDLNKMDVAHVMNDGLIALKHLQLTKLNAGPDGHIVVATLGLQALQAEEGMPDKHILRMETANLAELNIHPGSRVAVASLNIRDGDIRKPQASALGGMQLLGAFEQASLNQFQMNDNDSGSFEQFKLDKVQLPVVGGKSLGSVGMIQATHAVLAKGGVYHVRQMKVDQLQAHLVKRKSGWVLPATGQQPQPSAHRVALKVSGNKSSDKRPRVLIDEVVIGAGSRVGVRDETLSPPLKTSIQVQRFHFAPLDSAGQQRGKLDALLKLGKSGSLKVNGVLNPAPGKRLFADLKLALKNLDLPPLSGYVEADLGKPIKTGQMNLNSDVRIERSVIYSKNHVLIRKLQLGEVRGDVRGEVRGAAAKSEKSGQQLSLAGGMSVDMALGMLQNDRGDVELDVPVKGALDNPDINLSHIINKALLTSLKTGAMTYAALALQPYGTIVLVADVAAGLIKDAAKPRLTPIAFAERKQTLSPQMNDYISKIAALMQKKDFRLQVCGVATRIEGEVVMQPATSKSVEQGVTTASVALAALNDVQLLALAQSRSDLVLAALREHGIVASRLFNCSPRIDEGREHSQPGVELMLD